MSFTRSRTTVSVSIFLSYQLIVLLRAFLGCKSFFVAE